MLFCTSSRLIICFCFAFEKGSVRTKARLLPTDVIIFWQCDFPIFLYFYFYVQPYACFFPEEAQEGLPPG